MIFGDGQKGWFKMVEKPICVYMRVSTEKQDLENQRIAVENWLKLHGLSWRDVDYRLEDVESGAEDNRPGFQELWRLVKNRQVRSIIVYEISRLSRKQRTLINFLYDCVESDITIYSIRESYLSEWLKEPKSRAIIVGLLSILYDLERQLISERTRAGLERAKAEGKQIGRPRKDIDVRKLKELYEKGYPLKWIAKELGVSASTVKRRMKELRLQ